MTEMVYRTVIRQQSGGQILTTIRHTVQELRQLNPELRRCSLKDVALRPNKALINVTFYFQKRSKNSNP